jgi:RNA polymerase sigma-70 factor (ECF subfamily)
LTIHFITWQKSFPVADESTTELLLRAKSGDAERLGRLLEQYRGYLLMLAHRCLDERLRRRIDPADIVQHTYLEAQRDLPHFRGATPAEFAAWIRNILKHNVASAVARHVSAQKRSIGREVNVGTDSGAANWFAQMPGSTTSPSRRVMREEAAMAMLDALAQIPETQAEAVRLRYMEGLSLAEICERMGKSETAAAGLLKRGLRKLREIMVE